MILIVKKWFSKLYWFEIFFLRNLTISVLIFIACDVLALNLTELELIFVAFRNMSFPTILGIHRLDINFKSYGISKNWFLSSRNDSLSHTDSIVFFLRSLTISVLIFIACDVLALNLAELELIFVTFRSMNCSRYSTAVRISNRYFYHFLPFQHKSVRHWH